MKQLFTLPLFFLVLAFPLNAQPFNDSLNVRELTGQAESLFQAGKLDSAYAFITRALSYAKKIGNKTELAWGMVSVSNMLIQQRKLNTAQFFVEMYTRIATQTNDTLLSAIGLFQSGQISLHNDDPDKAIIALDKSIKNGLGKKPSLYLANAYNDLGFAWGMKGELERKSLFLLKALGMFQYLNDDDGMAQAMGNLSTVYYELGNRDKAIEYGKQSLKYREKSGDIDRLSIACCNLSQYYLGIDNDEAERYRVLCDKYARQTGLESRLIHSYITSSLVANARKNNKDAFDYELKVIALLEKSGSDNRMLARRYISAAFYTDLLKLDSSATIDYFNKSIALSQKSGDRMTLKDAFLYLSDYHSRRKNFQDAYFSYKKYILFRDSLLNAEKEERIAELENQYETTRKDNEIARLNNEQRIKQLEIEKQRAIIAGNTAAALQKQNEIDLLSKTKELQEVTLGKQAEELEKQVLLVKNNQQQLQITAQENKLNARQLRNQKNMRNLLLASIVLFALLGITWFNRYQLKRKLEQQKSVLAMRNNISRDLHDDIGASLSNINILNELARRSIAQPEKSKEYLIKASEDIQRISESLSDIVWNINPKYDDLQNLFIRMKRYAADMLDGKNISGRFEFPGDEITLHMSMTQRRDLYLIFKEAVNNLVKYSGADRADISITTQNRQIEMIIKDNGKGFDSKTITTGNGLQNMVQRARNAGAEIKVNAAPGAGTVVHLVMPLQE